MSIRIIVPVDGLREHELVAALKPLGFTTGALYRVLDGDTLISPRDYVYVSRKGYSDYYFTAAGVRALVGLFDLATVTVIEAAPVAEAPVIPPPLSQPAPRPGIEPKDRRPWWQREAGD